MFSFFCQKIVNAGGYAAVFVNFFMIGFWFFNCNRAGLIVMPNSDTFLYYASTVPKGLIVGFSRHNSKICGASYGFWLTSRPVPTTF